MDVKCRWTVLQTASVHLHLATIPLNHLKSPKMFIRFREIYCMATCRQIGLVFEDFCLPVEVVRNQTRHLICDGPWHILALLLLTAAMVSHAIKMQIFKYSNKYPYANTTRGPSEKLINLLVRLYNFFRKSSNEQSK